MMTKKVEEILKELKKELERVKKDYIKENPNEKKIHYIDYNYRNWNCPLDGIDYALMIIKNLDIKNKK